MKQGKIYQAKEVEETCSECGAVKNTKTRFPFHEKYGVYCGTTNAGWLIFRLSGQRECILDGGTFEEVKLDIKFMGDEESGSIISLKEGV